MSEVLRDDKGRIIKGSPALYRGGKGPGFRGCAKSIMAKTNNGEDLINWAMTLWKDVTAPIQMRWDAFNWLSDRAFGRPVSMLDVKATVNDVRSMSDLSVLTDAELDLIDAQFRAAKERSKVLDVPSEEHK